MRFLAETGEEINVNDDNENVTLDQLAISVRSVATYDNCSSRRPLPYFFTASGLPRLQK